MKTQKEFKVGDRVEWTKRGKKVDGTIRSIAEDSKGVMSATVQRDTYGRYLVPLEKLTHA